MARRRAILDSLAVGIIRSRACLWPPSRTVYERIDKLQSQVISWMGSLRRDPGETDAQYCIRRNRFVGTWRGTRWSYYAALSFSGDVVLSHGQAPGRACVPCLSLSRQRLGHGTACRELADHRGWHGDLAHAHTVRQITCVQMGHRMGGHAGPRRHRGPTRARPGSDPSAGGPQSSPRPGPTGSAGPLAQLTAPLPVFPGLAR